MVRLTKPRIRIAAMVYKAEFFDKRSCGVKVQVMADAKNRTPGMLSTP
jgi:hypothetical protein